MTQKKENLEDLLHCGVVKNLDFYLRAAGAKNLGCSKNADPKKSLKINIYYTVV